MFPKNKVNLIYRLLCLISYLIVIAFVNSLVTTIILLVFFTILGICEKSFRDIEFIIISLAICGLCYLFNNYILLKIILIIDYSFYFLDTSYYRQEDEVVDTKNYLRFKKNKKKGSNNITAVYLTVHLGLLFFAIVVG